MLLPPVVVALRGRAPLRGGGGLSRRPIVLPLPGWCERWFCLGLCGAPGAPQVVPQVPEAERWCRSRPRCPLLRLLPWGLRVGPEEELSSLGGVVEVVERGAPLPRGVRGALRFPPLAVGHSSLPQVSRSASVGGPMRGDRWVVERDPPSVRKPSLAI